MCAFVEVERANERVQSACLVGEYVLNVLSVFVLDACMRLCSTQLLL